MFAIVIETTHGPAEGVIGDFDSEALAREYLQERGWHKSIGRWWAHGSSEEGSNRAVIHKMQSPKKRRAKAPKARCRKRE